MYKEKLDLLNKKVSEVLKERTEFLDSLMKSTAKFKVGDDIYSLTTGKRVGTVSRVYRYFKERGNLLLDDSLRIDYEFETEPGSMCFSNTSCTPSELFGTLDEAIAIANKLTSDLEGKRKLC